MRRFIGLLGVNILAAALLANSAQALPLLINGDFDGVSGAVGEIFGTPLERLSGWDVYGDIPGWSTTGGAGIEIQASGVVTQAHSGGFYVELDSHSYGGQSNSAMTQYVELAEGIYSLSFYYQPRTTRPGDNGIAVFFDGEQIGAADGVRGDGTGWTEYSFELAGVGAGLHSIRFEAFGLENTLGGFIDTVSLDALSIAHTPEPSTVLLVGLGLVGLASRGRRH
jgi:hypothetical protein